MLDPNQIALGCFNAGQIDEAERICHEILSRKSTDPTALLLLATAANSRNEHARALELVGRALGGGSHLAELYVQRALAHSALGAGPSGLDAITRALAISPNVQKGYEILASMLMPGERYYDVLRRMHRHLKPRSYVEIGVSSGASIVLAEPPTIAVGIDPTPHLQTAPSATSKIFPLTSDEYFATRDVRADIECNEVDLSFIDGLHIFEQALRDFINIERFAGPRTTITIHDCLPIDSLTASRERTTVFWIGDIWKLTLCLHERRPDLEIFVIPTPPSGLCVVRGLDHGSTILSDGFDKIVADYRDLDVESTVERRRSTLRMVTNRWNDIEARLPAP